MFSSDLGFTWFAFESWLQVIAMIWWEKGSPSNGLYYSNLVWLIFSCFCIEFAWCYVWLLENCIKLFCIKANCWPRLYETSSLLVIKFCWLISTFYIKNRFLHFSNFLANCKQAVIILAVAGGVGSHCHVFSYSNHK